MKRRPNPRRSHGTEGDDQSRAFRALPVSILVAFRKRNQLWWRNRGLHPQRALMQDSCSPARSCAFGLILSVAIVGICRGQSYVHIESDLARGAREQIERALSEVGSISCVDKPLSELVDDLSRQMGLSIIVRRKALEEAAFDYDQPITAKIHGASYRSMLRLILSEHDLTWLIRDEVLLITTREDAESDLETRLYPVLDLVALE